MAKNKRTISVIHRNVADWHGEQGCIHYTNGQRDQYRYDKEQMQLAAYHFRIADRLMR